MFHVGKARPRGQRERLTHCRRLGPDEAPVYNASEHALRVGEGREQQITMRLKSTPGPGTWHEMFAAARCVDNQ
jgi:hypothetical protein